MNSYEASRRHIVQTNTDHQDNQQIPAFYATLITELEEDVQIAIGESRGSLLVGYAGMGTKYLTQGTERGHGLKTQ